MEWTFYLGVTIHCLLTSLHSFFPCALLASLCYLMSIFPLLLSSLFKVLSSTIMSSFLSNSAIDLGSSDSGDIEQPIMDQEIISIDDLSFKDTHRGASHGESSSR